MIENTLIVLAMAIAFCLLLFLGYRAFRANRALTATESSGGPSPTRPRTLEVGEKLRSYSPPDPAPAPGPAVAERPETDRSRRASHPEDPPIYRPRRPAPAPGKLFDPFAEQHSASRRAQEARQKSQIVATGAATDYYALIGVQRTASLDQIKAAYRREAAKVHPDRFFGDPLKKREAEEHLRLLNKAIQVLRDPVRRAQYDARLA